ncbi:unnamed protein product [Prunus brigantina]
MFLMIESSQGRQEGRLIYSIVSTVSISTHIGKICIVDEGVSVVAFEEGRIV